MSDLEAKLIAIYEHHGIVDQHSYDVLDEIDYPETMEAIVNDVHDIIFNQLKERKKERYQVDKLKRAGALLAGYKSLAHTIQSNGGRFDTYTASNAYYCDNEHLYNTPHLVKYFVVGFANDQGNQPYCKILTHCLDASSISAFLDAGYSVVLCNDFYAKTTAAQLFELCYDPDYRAQLLKRCKAENERIEEIREANEN